MAKSARLTVQERPRGAAQVRGQGWWPRGATQLSRSVAARRKHPTSEVRGGGREELPPHLRSGTVAESARLRGCRNGGEELPKSEVRSGGREELPRVQGQSRPGGNTLCPMSGVAGRSHLAPEARGSSPEEPPHTGGQGR